jgi:NDP-sugar pyrophosphorylase family protein
MKAVILAAGQGARLRPLTYAIPKPLLPVGGRPVIDYVLDNIASCGEIDEVYVAVSHMADAIEDYFRHADHHKVKVSVVRVLGWETGGDLKTVLIEKGVSGPVLVCYGDNVTKLDVGKVIAAHRKHKGNATLSLFPVPREDVPRFGIAELDGERITRFIEKPAAGQTESVLANAGYFVLEPKALEDVRMRKFKLESAYFPQWAKEGGLYGDIQPLKMWIDIGTLESYRAANRLVEEILPPPEAKVRK